MLSLEHGSLRSKFGWRVEEISLSLAPGEVLAVVGPNGAGKSSVLKLLAGELSCDKGRVLIDSTDIKTLPAKSLALQRAVLPQESSLTFNFKVYEVVAMGRSPHLGCGDAEDRRVVSWALERTDTVYLAERDYTTLSGGERQRVHLARVLAQTGPDNGTGRYLLLDEPTSALDLAHQHAVLEIARDLASQLGLGVLAVLHDLNLAATYADRVAMIKDAKLAGVGKPCDVLTPSAINSVFDMRVRVLPHPAQKDCPLIVADGRCGIDSRKTAGRNQLKCHLVGADE